MGAKIDARVPALGDRVVVLEVRVIGSKGEYTSWRATRASGDFDLRTFEIRAYPVQSVERPAAGHRLARSSLVTSTQTGLFAVVAREVHWILRDLVARFLLFGVPVIAFGDALEVVSRAVSATLRQWKLRDFPPLGEAIWHPHPPGRLRPSDQ